MTCFSAEKHRKRGVDSGGCYTYQIARATDMFCGIWGWKKIWFGGSEVCLFCPNTRTHTPDPELLPSPHFGLERRARWSVHQACSGNGGSLAYAIGCANIVECSEAVPCCCAIDAHCGDDS